MLPPPPPPPPPRKTNQASPATDQKHKPATIVTDKDRFIKQLKDTVNFDPRLWDAVWKKTYSGKTIEWDLTLSAIQKHKWKSGSPAKKQKYYLIEFEDGVQIITTLKKTESSPVTMITKAQLKKLQQLKKGARLKVTGTLYGSWKTADKTLQTSTDAPREIKTILITSFNYKPTKDK
jgi:hypothetical protein